jgi:hypothetical protein
MHYIIYSLLLIMLILGGLSTYSYVDIKEETDNSLYAKHISLANLVVCFLFSFLLGFLFYMNYLNKNRTLVIIFFILLLVGILFAVSYYFLAEEIKDKSGYTEAYDNLKTNSNRYNITFVNFNFILAIVTFVFLLIMATYTYALESNYDKNKDHKLSINNNRTLVVDNLNDNEKIRRVLIM